MLYCDGEFFCSLGDKRFNVTLYNFTIALNVRVDAEPECAEDRSVKITELEVPLLYSALEPSFDGLEPAFESVLQGVLTFVIESQNIMLVAALKTFIVQYLNNIFC